MFQTYVHRWWYMITPIFIARFYVLMVAHAFLLFISHPDFEELGNVYFSGICGEFYGDIKMKN